MKLYGTKIEPQHIYKILFAPARSEPPGSSAMYNVLRGVVAVQSYAIACLVIFMVLTAYVFADKYYFHLVVIDRNAFPKELVNLVGLDEPNLTRTAITNMAEHIATRVQSYGFHNADQRLLEAKRLFTDDAWLAFAKAHLKPGHLDEFKRNQQILTTIASKQPVIVSEGKENGVQRWVLEMPFISSYMAGQSTSTKSGVLRITLVRAPVDKYPEGVAIAEWREMGGG